MFIPFFVYNHFFLNLNYRKHTFSYPSFIDEKFTNKSATEIFSFLCLIIDYLKIINYFCSFKYS
ncbi:hypothetical protein HMPREF9071_2202 [Capnocytophaga sp. oral taxon 338 str. F0234]|nr:hypothetical protein HMPREF9071_2202 [Capnocytophaga sp. oral taxon 338 str. F0234]